MRPTLIRVSYLCSNMDAMITTDDIAILEFEELHPRHSGFKADAIREAFGLTSARYYARLRRLTRLQEAVARYPQLCARVQRQTERGQAERAQLTRWAA
jgi:succinate dehydrogenase/fumarate reductase flavoprotein subunit